jgi:formate dehydrogenase alpha subunit
MALLTKSPRIEKHRRNIVRLMIAEHPESCIVCSKGNRCRLRQLAGELGIGEINLYQMPNYKNLEQANPFIIRDLSKCILCGKCIRADHELVVTGAIDYNLRGSKSRPATVYDLPLEHSNCTFCGTCLSICPTGAISPKSWYIGTPEREMNSICGFCSVGCNLKLGVVGEKVVEVNPAHIKNSVNDATLCVKGHFAHDFLNSVKRLTQPLIRKENEYAPVSWDDALDEVARRLLEIKKQNGSQSIAFLGSSKCTNEENYLFQKIARTILKTNNVDNGGYMSGRLFLRLVEKRTDMEGRFHFFAGPLSWLEQAEAVFVIGGDPANSAPVVNYYLKRGSKKGVPIIVVSPMWIELVKYCSVWLRPLTGEDRGNTTLDPYYLELINSLSAILLEEEGYDFSFISRFTEGFEDYKKALASIDRKKISQNAGIDDESLKMAAAILKGKKISFVIGDGFQLQRYGMESMEALLNLSLMTGSIGYKGAGFYVLAGENNTLGAWDMGAVPDSLPGRLMLEDDYSRKGWENIWKTEISSDSGLDMFQMIEAAEDGKLKALYIMGENPLRSLPQSGRVLNALKKLDFLVVQDILSNETSKIADVVLPGAAFSEKGGSFTNVEGRIQTFSPAVEPPKNARTDLEILGLLAEKMGHPEFCKSPEEIRKEISSVIPYCFSSNSRRDSLWIRTTDKRKRLPDEAKKKSISFSPITVIEKFTPDDEYPFNAILGPLHYHLGSGTRTSYSPRILECNGKGEIEISINDAKSLSLVDGDFVRLLSCCGSIGRKIKVNKNLRSGLLFIPLGYNNNDAKNLIQLTSLQDSDTNGWDTCRVRIEKV